MARIGYARVSSEDQNEERQLAAFREQGVEKVYLDKLSGKNARRPQLQAMFAYVREGDTVIVTDFSRLARSTVDMLQIVGALKEKAVRLVSLKENLDTDTPQGRFMLTVFAALAELERETIRERQQEGIRIAKAAGKYKGRKPLPLDEHFFCSECKKWRAGSQTAAETQRRLGMKPNRFYRLARKYGFFGEDEKHGK
ncbi:MAG: recombinase family protein [Oscillospiraceae bacterium]|nr:recombinase family protein [Oscillospiraceae bacterium]MBR3448395.1 recombinase family protein [Oscillospiraceae bacterium]MBR4199992.1 recombinase family protein [Oscillospiraceae bacterium]